MTIAIYSRKSKFTGKGDSIENQIVKCKQFIQFKFDIEPDNIEIFIDEGFSGKNENRPEYKKMIGAVKNKKIDSIVIYQLNRLGRNARDIHNTMQMCDDIGVIIYSATEGFDSSTSFGRALIGILASLAQLEREQLAERIKDNMYTLAKMGRWLGGQTPLGFDGTREYYIDDNGKERSVTQLKKNNSELKIIRAIYKKYLEEKSLSKVSKWSLSNNFKGKNGGNIDKSAINIILQNPVYVKSDDTIFNYLNNNGYEIYGEPNGNGILRYGKNNENIAAISKHKGIIESKDWLMVQQILKENTEKAPALGSSKLGLLTGILKCKCGANMQIRYGPKRKDGSNNHYYMCSMKVNSGGTRCDSKNLNGPLFEKALIDYLKNYNKNTLIKELKNNFKENEKIDYYLNVENINKKIYEFKKSINRLLSKLKVIDDNDVSIILIDEIKALKNNIKELNFKKDLLINKESKFTLTQSTIISIINSLNDFSNSCDNLSNYERQKLLRTLLDSVIYDNKEIHIKFKV